jgi:hypothetical protein
MSIIQFKLSVQDTTIPEEEIQEILRLFAVELENEGGQVSQLSLPAQQIPGMISKGKPNQDFLNVKINTDKLVVFAKWLHRRLLGQTTKVKFEVENTAKIEFDGRQEDFPSVMREFERFISVVSTKDNEHG